MDEKSGSGRTSTPRGQVQIVLIEIVDLWGDAVSRWLSADPREAPPSTHVADVVAHLIDVTRVAGLERALTDRETGEVANHLRRISGAIVPALLHLSQGRDHRRLLLALTRALMDLPSVDPYREAKDSIIGSMREIVRIEHAAREETLSWMWRTGHGRNPRWRLAHGILYPEQRERATGTGRISISLGLFDDADAEALSESERSRRSVNELLKRIIPLIEDRFVVDVIVDDKSVSYVQGLREEDGALHLEVGSPALLRVPGAPDRIADLLELGWNAPEPDLPNPWRLVALDELLPSAVAEMLVRAMEVGHDAFTDLPIDAVVSTSPATLGEAVLNDDAPVVSVKLSDDGPTITVHEQNPSSDPIPGTILERWADAIENGLRAKLESRRSLLVEAASILVESATTRQRMRAATGAPVEPDQFELITRMTSLVLPAAARPPLPYTRKLPPKKPAKKLAKKQD